MGLFSRNQRCRLWPRPGHVLEGAGSPGSCDSYLVTQGVEGSAHGCECSLCGSFSSNWLQKPACFMVQKPWWAPQIEVHHEMKMGMDKSLKVYEK